MKRKKIMNQDHIFIEIILDNFKSFGHTNKYKYLNNNIISLKNGICHLSKFFKKLNKITQSNVSNKEKINKLINTKINGKQIFDTESAKLIIKLMKFSYNNNYKNKKVGELDTQIKKNLKSKYKHLKKTIILSGGSNLQKLNELQGRIDTDPSLYNFNSLGKTMSHQIRNSNILDNFNQYENGVSENLKALELDKKTIDLSVIPEILETLTDKEFKIPLNLNDIILIGFSLLPAIGWIFDIFMILRALIEERYLYAILMTINCYQYLFYKLISFGLLGYDMGPVIKLFYVAPYALKTFNYENIRIKLSDFLNNININFNKNLLFR